VFTIPSIEMVFLIIIPGMTFGENDSYIQTSGVGVSLGKQLKWPDDYFSLVTSLNYTRYVLKDYQIFQGLAMEFQTTST
jgi:hypothetical protein